MHRDPGLVKQDASVWWIFDMQPCLRVESMTGQADTLLFPPPMDTLQRATVRADGLQPHQLVGLPNGERPSAEEFRGR
jgi:hypothetical protein